MKNPFKKEVKTAPVVKVAPVVDVIKAEVKKKVVVNDAQYDYETRGKKTV